MWSITSTTDSHCVWHLVAYHVLRLSQTCVSKVLSLPSSSILPSSQTLLFLWGLTYRSTDMCTTTTACKDCFIYSIFFYCDTHFIGVILNWTCISKVCLCFKACCYFQALRGLEKSQAHCLRLQLKLKKKKKKKTVFIKLLLGLQYWGFYNADIRNIGEQIVARSKKG